MDNNWIVSDKFNHKIQMKKDTSSLQLILLGPSLDTIKNQKDQEVINYSQNKWPY